ncbi:MAG: dehydrogenase subunit [Bacteroidota bacterium]|nr:dehydrogenase subunit [Bacteroidota bacterium]
MDLSFLVTMKFEMALTLIIFILLFLKIGDKTSNASIIRIANALLIISFGLCFLPGKNEVLFSGMFRRTPLLVLEKGVLLVATIIISLSSFQWLKNHKHLPEFYMLLLSSLLGMFFMMSSGNLLMFYLGLELSTIPLAALCNFDLDKKISSEAAMKMILSSAFSSGILLFGISMIYGTTGYLDYTAISTSLSGTPLQVFAFILIFTGFAFKLSVVPFHLWTADVYEGSPIAVTAFLSVVSKGSMAFVFITSLYWVFGSLSTTWYYMLAFTAVITMVVGNLFALRQSNLKRFLAFSSIAQVGYLLIGISGFSNMSLGIGSVVYFILIYVFSNLAAFAVISVISSLTGKETIEDYKGLYKSNPTLALVMALSLFSLAGIPPTAGFFGKLFLLTSGAGMNNWPLIIIASLNLIISLYYYLRIIRAMFIDESQEPMVKLSFSSGEILAFMLCAGGILSVGFLKGLFEMIFNVSSGL